ncbi:MAG TPA: tetratricopeptide repeat protein [Cyclobacteriaceae bacterium]|nr:tetratricopeptide repeat protein [Cyclobacteriaceae bacterium]
MPSIKRKSDSRMFFAHLTFNVSNLEQSVQKTSLATRPSRMRAKYPFPASFLRLLTIGWIVFSLVLTNGRVLGQQPRQWLDSARALAPENALPVLRRGLSSPGTTPAEKAGLQLLAGTIFSDLARYDSALIYFNRALVASTNTNDSTGIAEAHYGTGKVYILTAKYKEAIVANQKAFVLYQKTRNNDGAVKSLLGLGYSSLKTKKYPQAREYYNQALERAQRNKAFELMVEAYDGLATVYQAQKDFKKAISAVRFMQGAYDSIVKRDHRRETKRLENKYSRMILEKDSLLLIAEAQHSQVKTDRLLRLIEREDIRLTFYSVALGLTFVLLFFVGAWLITRQKTKIAESRLRSEQAGIKLANEQFELISQQVSDELTKELNTGPSASLIHNMVDMMWLINPNNKSLESLIAYIREQTNALLKQSGINYMIVVPDRTPNVMLSSLERLNLYVVTKELINYAVNSKATGLTLSITMEGRQVIFKVKDHAPLDEAKLKKRPDDLRLHREKMEQINGTIGVISEKGAMVVIYRVDLPMAGQP